MTGTKNAPAAPPFWKTRRLHEMTRVEFEAICDGSARGD